jgi:O-succinylbenzoic acid--CoA ligase
VEPWLRSRARRHPDAPALVCGGVVTSFHALDARVDLVARRIAAAGVAVGDRVVLCAAPAPRTIEIIHAVQRLGATLVPIGTRTTACEARALVARVRPALVMYDDAGAGVVAPARGSDAPRTLDATRGLDDLAPGSPRVLHDVLDPAAFHSMLFTSGTTGNAKAACLSHANYAASAGAAARHLGVSARDRWLACMPLSHVGGLSIVLRGAVTGFAVVLHARFDPDDVNRAIAAGGVTIVSVVPTMLVRMLDALGDAVYPPSLRVVLTGGGPLPAAMLARARAAGVPVAPTYGLTEAGSQVATGRPGVVPPAALPLPGTEVRIAAPDDDGVGEILVRAPTVMTGYFEDAAATAAALRDGWLHTGDLGRLDAAGALSVVGRRTDLIVTGGENVYPVEVERVLAEHPDVAEVAVFGVPDDVWGERVVATIVPARGALDGPALRAWAAARLAAFKIPRDIRVAAALPRTASGKVRRAALRAAAVSRASVS